MTATATRARLVTAAGRGIGLGRLLARGGEGRVLEVADAPELVAKVYDAPPDPTRAAKLRAMAAAPPEVRPTGAAWPVDLLLTDVGTPAGFTMPRLHGRHDIFRMAASGDRRRFFPDADYRALVATAANLARAVASVHAAGHVVGDVNERFAMVDARCTVTLIDCDSFQVQAGGRVYPCDVGVTMYQPPELQGASSFRGLPRSRNHDCFGLAVLVFQLLFLGRHPFAGRTAGNGEAPELPEAIRRAAFAWARVPAARGGLSLPPNAVTMGAVGDELAGMFEHAFGAGGSGEGRPPAVDWAAALDRHAASLHRCGVEPRHWHLGTECQLCTVEGMLGASIFAPGGAVPAVDLDAEVEALWSGIAELPALSLRPHSPQLDASVRRAPGRDYPSLPDRGSMLQLLEQVGLVSTPDHATEVQRRRVVLAAARVRHATLLAAWRASPMVSEWHAALGHLRAARDALWVMNAIIRARAAENARARALRALLAAHPVAECDPRGLNPRLAAELRAFGVESAADVSEAVLARIPRVSGTRAVELVAWRDGLMRSGRAARSQVTQADVAAAVRPQAEQRARLLDVLRAGAARLGELHAREMADRTEALAALEHAAREMAEAEMDVAVPVPE